MACGVVKVATEGDDHGLHGKAAAMTCHHQLAGWVLPVLKSCVARGTAVAAWLWGSLQGSAPMLCRLCGARERCGWTRFATMPPSTAAPFQVERMQPVPPHRDTGSHRAHRAGATSCASHEVTLAALAIWSKLTSPWLVSNPADNKLNQRWLDYWNFAEDAPNLNFYTGNNLGVGLAHTVKIQMSPDPARPNSATVRNCSFTSKTLR